jgi:hypothetical protein
MTTIETILQYPGAHYQYKHRLADESTPPLTCQIIGIDFQDQNEPIHVFCEAKGIGNRRTWTGPGSLTPILRPFSALTTKLPDGTVPAEVIMKGRGWTIKDGESLRYMPAGGYSPLTQERIEWVKNGEVILNGGVPVELTPDFTTGRWAMSWIVDYLRRHHFAVGLQPDQFLPKH